MRFNVLTGNAFGWPLRKFLRDLPQDYIGTMSKVQARHGDLVHWRMFAGMVNLAFISDSTLNRELFVRNTDALGKSPSQIQTFLFAAGQSVATAHGDAWRTKRKEANNLFSRSAVEASCAGQVAVTQDYITGLPATPQQALTVARRLAAVTSSRGILGRAISLEEADKQIAFSKAAADRFNVESGQLFARPDWMQAPWRGELTRRKNEVFPIVQNAVDALRASNAPNDGLMNHYVNGDFITSNDDEMHSILVGLLMGAQDNIAAAAAWVLAFLAQHPDLQGQIRTELSQKGSQASDLHGCALLNATLCEVLRMRPPAPANQPRVLQKRVELAGHQLPRGTYVFNSFYNMHRDPAVFTDPDRFDPTRFLDGTLARSPSFAPFGHGPRNCVAQGMAMQQLMAIIAGSLRHHRLETNQQTLPAITQMPFLTPAPFEVTFRKIT